VALVGMAVAARAVAAGDIARYLVAEQAFRVPTLVGSFEWEKARLEEVL
jgi:hypothetical protein